MGIVEDEPDRQSKVEVGTEGNSAIAVLHTALHVESVAEGT